MTLRRRQRPPARQSAQATLEFALVVPVFLLLMFGLIDFSRLLFTYVSISNGARELARTAAVSTNYNGPQAITAFLNSTIIAGGQNSVTDSITIREGSMACARSLDTGGTCSTSPTVVTCTLPVTTTSCVVPAPPRGGFVEVKVAYTFQFNPLFQSQVQGIVDASFMRPTALVNTTARAYVE